MIVPKTTLVLARTGRGLAIVTAGMQRYAWVLGGGLGLGLACLPAPFVCSDNGDCSQSAEGVCEAQGVCSYPDEDCESGRRYSQFGANSAGSCVEPSTTTSGESTNTSQNPATSSGSSGPLESTTTQDATTASTTNMAEESDDGSGSSSSGEIDPTICDGITCSDHGECAPVDGEPTCACDPGWWVSDLECLDDPCATAQCYFIDDVGGEDTADGSRETPWRTFARASMGLADAQPGDHFLFRRGGTFSEPIQSFFVIGSDGTADAPVVIGGYGAPEDPEPRLLIETLQLIDTSYVTVRDLNIIGSDGPCIRISRSHHLIVHDNEISQCPIRGIRVGDTSAYLTIFRNYIHDVVSKSGIFIADTDWSTPNPEVVGSHHWVADNVIATIADEGIEVTFDSLAPDYEVGDVKIVGNRVGDTGRAGIRGVMRFGWAAGNVTVNGGQEDSNTVLGSLVFRGEETLVRGNVVAGSEETLQLTNQSRVLLNTVIQTGQNGSVRVSGSDGIEFFDNVVAADGGLLVNVASDDTNSSFDRNLYTPDDQGDCAFEANSADLNFQAWQDDQGFDANGECGPTAGAGSIVVDAAPPFDAAFWNALVPTPNWESCDDKGAINCDGDVRRVSLPRIDGLPEGEGRGWEGPLLIQQKYPL